MSVTRGAQQSVHYINLNINFKFQTNFVNADQFVLRNSNLLTNVDILAESGPLEGNIGEGD